MSFEEIQFPADISYGAAGGPMFLTDVVSTVSGYEQRNAKWAQARAKYNVASGVKTPTQWQALIAFFRARQGKAIGFRFKDWSDYIAENVQIGVGDDLATQFQLIKIYSSGSVAVSRTITKPVAGTVNIYVNSQLQSSDITIDNLTGIISFDSPPSAGEIITADFEFDVPVRFDTDEMSVSMDGFDAGNWNNIPLIEVRI